MKNLYLSLPYLKIKLKLVPYIQVAFNVILKNVFALIII